MSREVNFLVATAITFAVSLVVVVIFWRTLQTALHVRATPESPARFWMRYWSVFLVLAPQLVVILGRNIARREDPSFFQIVDLVGVGLSAFFFALVAVGMGVAILLRTYSTAIYVSPEHADDLSRMLEKIQLLRARELVQRDSEHRNSERADIVEVAVTALSPRDNV